jgi:hypothetical protein
VSRSIACAVGVGLVLAGVAIAQEPKAPPAPDEPPAVVALFEDDADALIPHLNNMGMADASTAEKEETTHFAGAASLSVTDFQRFNGRIPGWQHRVAAEPGPGEYRYLRFAWKRTEADGVMLQLHAADNRWHRYCAGTLSERTLGFGPRTRVAEAVPRRWELVTRDLFADFGPMTITGIGLSALEGPGKAYFDHVYLGRSVEDLDRVTAALKKVVESPEPAATGSSRPRPWGLALGTAALVAGLGLAGVVGWLVRRRRQSVPARQLRADASPRGTCPHCGKPVRIRDEVVGRRVKCPACGRAFAAPARTAE